MVAESKQTAPPLSQPGRDRSPPYPFVSLRTAVERVAALDATFGRHPAPIDKLGLAWKMKEKSSQALQTAAALKAFGLVDYLGKTDNRTVAVSGPARTYLRAQQESVKADVLKLCALKPKSIAMCWALWGADRPPDAVCLDHLVLKQKFTDSAARTLLRVYDETVAFAELANGDNIPASTEEADDIEQLPEPTDMQQDRSTTWPSGALRSFPQAGPSTAAASPASGHDDKYDLGDGRAFVLRWPTSFSAAEFEEFEAWVALLQKKLKRSVQQ